MKTIVTLPRELEVKSIKIDPKTGTIEIEHRPLSRRAVMPVVYLTCVGTGGMEARATLALNSGSGLYNVVNDKADGNAAEFDLPPVEFAQRRAKKVANGQRLYSSSPNAAAQPPAAKT